MLDERTKVEVTVNFYPKKGPSWSVHGSNTREVGDSNITALGIDTLKAVIDQIKSDTTPKAKRE